MSDQPPIPMGAVPHWHAARNPDALALVHGEDAWTWRALSDAVTDLARRLAAAGVTASDRVALSLPNGNAFVAATFAIWNVGATPLPLTANLPAGEIERLAALGAVRLLIDDIAALPGGIDVPLPAAPARFWKAIATGGSTGAPKLILSDRTAETDPTHYELFPWDLHQGRLGEPGGVMLNPGPLQHNGPFVHSFMNLFAGSTLIGMERFDAEEWLRLVARHKVGFSYLVPTMMHRIWMLPRAVREAYDLSSLKGIIHTAAPCAPWLKRAWIDWLGPERIWEAYGSTEAVASTVINGTEWLERPGSVGRFFFGARGEVRDEAGQSLAPGKTGLIWVRPAPGRPAGYAYLGAEPNIRDGWHAFGDLAAIDGDGYVFIADRRTDLILRGGNNVYPAEIEAVLESHPDVVSAVVIGLPDDDMGARIHAIIEASTDLADDLRALAAERLAPYKRPSSYEMVSAPLRDAAGKTRRAKLRDERL